MKSALEEDCEANKLKKPAFKRLKMLKQIDSHMRNTNMHSIFIDKGGLKFFNAWLSQMPDGSYPNQKVVATILQCLDLIDVNDEDRDELQKLESILEVYRDDCKSPAYEDCRRLAIKILDKWYSKRNQIVTDYSHFQEIDTQQKRFEKLIENEKKRFKERDDDDEEPKAKKRQRKIGPDQLAAQARLYQQQ